ncbi:MAG TPA: DegT/DnrJ/EryC1/StrS family aminotransferase [Tepidisphaeraceae bacterium]|jgi:dTDP-4-amino-4,6-dideoxygalactose transaminase
MQVPLLDLRQQYATIKDDVQAAILRVCDEQSLVLGPHVEAFENRLAAYCGTKHAVGVSSGTDALLVAMMAADIGAGDEVICPAFTFFATAGCVARLGARPVFVDIEPATFNIDVARIEAAITPRTKAIVPVDLFGQVCRIEAVNEIACRHGLVVIEDAAQAIGARRHDNPATSQAWAGCLSFYPTKNLGAFGDAGAVCCNDDALAEKIRKLRVHGSGHTYYHELLGGMFRLAAIQAAVLNVKLPHLDAWHAARRRHAAIYNDVLAGSRVVTPTIEQGNESIYNQYVVRVPDRDAVKNKLADKQIGSAVYYPLGLHLQQCFASLGHKTGDFPETERASAEVLALPVYPELTDEQVTYAATTLRDIIAA